MPYPLLLPALEGLLPPYTGCLLSNNPGSIICHFRQVPALWLRIWECQSSMKQLEPLRSPAAEKKSGIHSEEWSLPKPEPRGGGGLPVGHAGGVGGGVLAGQVVEF